MRRLRRCSSAIERLGCPVLTTYQAIGVVPEGHPQLAGLFTSGVIEASLLFEADLIVTIGFDQVEPMPTAWRYDVPVVAISEVAACATLAPITVEVLGPLATMLERVVVDQVRRLATTTPVQPRSPRPRRVLAGTSTGDFGPLELAAAVAAAAPAGDHRHRRRRRALPWRSCRSGRRSSRCSC